MSDIKKYGITMTYHEVCQGGVLKELEYTETTIWNKRKHKENDSSVLVYKKGTENPYCPVCRKKTKQLIAMQVDCEQGAWMCLKCLKHLAEKAENIISKSRRKK